MTKKDQIKEYISKHYKIGESFQTEEIKGYFKSLNYPDGTISGALDDLKNEGILENQASQGNGKYKDWWIRI